MSRSSTPEDQGRAQDSLREAILNWRAKQYDKDIDLDLDSSCGVSERRFSKRRKMSSKAPDPTDPNSLIDCWVGANEYLEPPFEDDFPPPSPPSSPVLLNIPSNAPSPPMSESNDPAIDTPSHVTKHTPFRFGMAGVVSVYPQLDWDQAKQYIKEEQPQLPVHSVDSFLHIVLDYRAESWRGVIDQVSSDQDLLRTYCKYRDEFFKTTREQDRYRPFINLCKAVAKNVSAICQNDASLPGEASSKWISQNECLINGSVCRRKPDVISVAKDFDEALGNRYWDDLDSWLEVKVAPEIRGGRQGVQVGNEDAGVVKLGTKRPLDDDTPFTPSNKAARESDAPHASKRIIMRSGYRSREQAELPVDDDLAQAVGYGLECLHSFARRLFSVGCFLLDGDLRFLYLDHGKIFITEPLTVLSEYTFDNELDCLKRFITFVIATSYSSSSCKGFDDAWKAPTNPSSRLPHRTGNASRSHSSSRRSEVPEVFGWNRLVGGLRFTATSVMERESGWGVLTQAAKLVEGQLELNGINVDVIAKIAWQPANALPEAELIQKAEGRGVQGLPQVLAAERGPLLSQLPRFRLEEELQIPWEPLHDRRLCIFIMPRYYPLFTSPKSRYDYDFHSLDDTDLVQTWRSLIETHQQLFMQGRILHRDISIDNLFSNPSASAPRRGTLLDLHRAKEVDGSSVTEPPFGSDFRTATIPFAAVELLSEGNQTSQHEDYHDLESFFWSLLWVLSEEQRLRHKWLHDDYEIRNRAAMRAKNQGTLSSPTARKGVQNTAAVEKIEYPKKPKLPQPLANLFRGNDVSGIEHAKLCFMDAIAAWARSMDDVEANTKFPTVFCVVESLRSAYQEMRAKQRTKKPTSRLTYQEFMQAINDGISHYHNSKATGS